MNAGEHGLKTRSLSASISVHLWLESRERFYDIVRMPGLCGAGTSGTLLAARREKWQSEIQLRALVSDWARSRTRQQVRSTVRAGRRLCTTMPANMAA